MKSLGVFEIKTAYLPLTKAELLAGVYENGNTALVFVDEVSKEPLLKATVNPLWLIPPTEVCIKDWSENEGLVEALITAKVIDPFPQGFYPCGFEVAESYNLTPALKEKLAAVYTD